MKAKFDIKTWLTENRERVINEYNRISNDEFFNGMTLKTYMTEIYNLMVINKVASEKRAESCMITFLQWTNIKATKMQVINDKDQALRNKYAGTAYMAMV